MVDSWTMVRSLCSTLLKPWLLRLPVGVLISKAVASSMILLLKVLFFFSCGILGGCQILKLVVAVMLVVRLVAVAGFGVLLGWFCDDVSIRGSCCELLILWWISMVCIPLGHFVVPHRSRLVIDDHLLLLTITVVLLIWRKSLLSSYSWWVTRAGDVLVRCCVF